VTITKTSVKYGLGDYISGSIRCEHEGRRHVVKFEKQGDHAEQWGANPDILKLTYPTFERLCGLSCVDE
jgi:hypothetical protein